MTNNTEQQAVPVAQEDREAIGELAIHLAATATADEEEHGEWTWRDIAAEATRYFHRLAATSLHDMQITPSASLPCKSGEGAVSVSEAIRRAKQHAGRVLGISWCNLEEISRVELILAALTPDATQTREAELVAACEAYVEAYDAGTGTIHVNKQIRAALTPDADNTREAEGSAGIAGQLTEAEDAIRGGALACSIMLDAKQAQWLSAALNARGGA